MRFYPLIAGVVIFAVGLNAAAAELPAGATILDPDIVWDVANPHSFAISPDGKRIAYISKGAIWSCPVDAGPPTKLAELPNTITDLIQLPPYEKAKNKVANHAQVLPFGDFQDLFAKTIHVCGLRWTPSQDGVVYALRKRLQSNAKIAAHQIMHASLDGVVTEIASIHRDVDEQPHSFDDFHLSADRTFIVASPSGCPLIWNATTERPQVTCFDLLLPSTTSERYLGIEIDTRQLVLVDADFQILKRYDVTFKSDRQSDLVWSADERFAICRRKGRYSDKWIALRVDLETGEQREFKGDHWTDKFEFTERGGEFLQFGIEGIRYDHLDQMTGGYLAIVPDGDGPPQELVHFLRIPPPSSLVALSDRPYYPGVLRCPDSSRFVIALPRTSQKHPGFLYHFIDRDGKKRPLAPDDQSQYLAPGHVLGLGNGGRTIVVRNQSQLFSMSVSAVLSQQEPGDD